MIQCKECSNGKRIDLPKSLTICREPSSYTLEELVARMNWSPAQSCKRPVWYSREEWGCENCTGFERRITGMKITQAQGNGQVVSLMKKL